MTTILSLGGSIVAPDAPDTGYLAAFRTLVAEYLGRSADRRLVMVVGGGGPARSWQKAYRTVLESPGAGASVVVSSGIGSSDVAPPGAGSSGSPPAAAPPSAPVPDEAEQDWIGIMATRLNAQLVKAVMAEWCPDPVVTDPEAPFTFSGRVLVAAGWKPGFSTDFDAVVLARRFGARTVLNLSNIAKVYTADPRLDPDAKPIDSISWADFRTLVGDTWSPGKNVPFDPVASREAAALGLGVICASGKDLDNLRNILEGGSFTGTVIGPLPGVSDR